MPVIRFYYLIINITKMQDVPLTKIRAEGFKGIIQVAINKLLTELICTGL